MSHNNPVNDRFEDLTYDRRQTNWSIVLSNGTTTTNTDATLAQHQSLGTSPLSVDLLKKMDNGKDITQLLKNARTELEWTWCTVHFYICDSFCNINRFNSHGREGHSQVFILSVKVTLSNSQD